MSAVRKPWVDLDSTKADLASFFQVRAKDLSKFGSTVNQTFEAYLFASTLSHYREAGWEVVVINPIDKVTKTRDFRLKFSTRGIPANYSYAVCTKGEQSVELRHQLRVATSHYRKSQRYKANICLDLAIIAPGAADGLGDRDAADNLMLISFGEAKHMNAFAELVAGFIGMVHEIQPVRLTSRKNKIYPDHQCPFLFISGFLLHTARGILETIERRKFDIAIFHLESPLAGELKRRIARADAQSSDTSLSSTSIVPFEPESFVDDTPF
jgi:hypothetical protein